MAHPQTLGNESPGYYVPAEDASTQTNNHDFYLLDHTQDASNQTADVEFIQLKSTQDANTQTSEDDFSSLKEFNSKDVNWTFPSETSEESRKRRATTVQMIGFITDIYKRSRPEICGLSIKQEFSNLHTPNQELDILDNFGKNEKLTAEQNTASNKTMFQKGDEACKMTDSKVSEVKKVILVDDMYVSHGPLWCWENTSQSRSYVENFINGSTLSALKLQPLVETEHQLSICVFCNKTISEHKEVHDRKDMYKCCFFRSDEENYLLRNISNLPTKHFYCNVCKLSYSVEGSHASDQTCNVCKENFECQRQLEDHYSIHELYHETNCRICEKKIDEHVTLSEGGKPFKCCFSKCKFRSGWKKDLKLHLYTHSNLNLFRCEICGKRFKQIPTARRHLTKTHPLCKLCGKRLFNSCLFKQHLFQEHGEKIAFSAINICY